MCGHAQARSSTVGLVASALSPSTSSTACTRRRSTRSRWPTRKRATLLAVSLCQLPSGTARQPPQVGAGLRVRHPRLHGGPHVLEESQFQRARQAVADAVVPPHHPLPTALAVQAVARVCAEGRCLLLVIVLVGLGRAFNSALHVGAVVRASVAGAVAAPLGWWHDARHASPKAECCPSAMALPWIGSDCRTQPLWQHDDESTWAARI
jgi:hypothetical protein